MSIRMHDLKNREFLVLNYFPLKLGSSNRRVTKPVHTVLISDLHELGSSLTERHGLVKEQRGINRLSYQSVNATAKNRTVVSTHVKDFGFLPDLMYHEG